jgi:teichuronic acid biosynthesis protein TuaE
MKFSMNKTMVIFTASLLLVLVNIILFPKLFFIHIFVIFYLFVIYKRIASNTREYLYLTTVLFALVSTNLVLPIGSRYAVYYFYISLFAYILNIFYVIKKNKILLKVNIKNKYFIFICIFLVYIIFSIFLAADKKIAIKSTINYLVMISFILMMIVENKKYQTLKRSFSFFTWIYTGIVLLGLLEVFGIKYGARNHYFDLGIFVEQYPFLKRVPEVFFYNPNNYAVLLILGMTAIFINRIFSDKNENKWLYNILFFISQINLIFTTSRTAWITIFIVYVVAFIFFLFKKNSKLANKSVKFGFVTLLIFVIFSFIPSMTPYYGKFNSTPILKKLNLYNVGKPTENNNVLVKVGDEGSINERFTLIFDVVDGVITNKHYLGFGVGNIGNYIQSKDNTYGIYNVHNFWFEILGDFGIVIFLYVIYIYLNLIFDLIRKSKKYNNELKRYSYMMAFGLVAFIFLAFGPSSVITFEPFWVLIGISSAIAVNNY